MVRVDPQRAQEYREAWAAWQKHLARLHEVFLDGAAIEPPQLKGLLNREARAKQRYDAAREALLGVGPADARIGAARIGAGRIDAGRIGRPRAPDLHSE